ncbi:hypothetical protein ACAW74_18350 [Fibrella sp. WM1]|uniref:hypothetical protein n=1 Tax=Fibrella musci TaxID=3242485 RepID=UPI0035220206
MRPLRLLFGLSFATLSCRTEVEPQEKAALVAILDFSQCANCGGWVIKVDNETFRSELPAQYQRPSTPVWLRYQRDESSEAKKAGNWITILSIRERLP